MIDYTFSKELKVKTNKINSFHTNGAISSPIDFSMKLSRNFERSPIPYILSFSKIKYKHLFYKHESIFMNFYRLFESL